MNGDEILISPEKCRVVTSEEFLDILRKHKKAKSLIVRGELRFSEDLLAEPSLDITHCIFESEFVISNMKDSNNLFFFFCIFKQRVLIFHNVYNILSFIKCEFDQYFSTKNLRAERFIIRECIINNSKELRLSEFIATNFTFIQNIATSDIYIKPLNTLFVLIGGSESQYLLTFSNFENPTIFEKFTVHSVSINKTDIVIKNIKTKFLSLAGELKNSSLFLNDISFKSGVLNYFSNFGNLKVNGLKPLNTDSILVIKNTILGQAMISSTDFTLFNRVLLKNSNVIEIRPVNVAWCKSNNLKENDFATLREDFRQLKVIAAKNEDIPSKLYFQKLEMHTFLKQMKGKRGHLIDKIILWTNYVSNDFGLNWAFALAWLMGLTVLWYTSIKFCLGYTIFDYTLIADEIGRFLLFLNPIHQFDKLFEISQMNSYLGGALFFDGISRITGAYLLYQFVSAFRKYSKK